MDRLRSAAGLNTSLLAAKASTPDLLRHVLEPVVDALGYDPESPSSVQRAYRFSPALPAADLVCIRHQFPEIAFWVDKKGNERFTQAVALSLRASAPPEAKGLKQLVFTSFQKWVVVDFQALPKIWKAERPRLDPPEEFLRAFGLVRPASGPHQGRDPNVLAKPAEVDAHDDPYEEVSYRSYTPAERTNTKPFRIRIRNESKEVRNWNEAALHAAQFHLRFARQLPTERLLPKQQGAYFSSNPSDLRSPKEISPSWFMEGNLAAELAWRIIERLMAKLGVPEKDYDVMYRRRVTRST